MNRLFIYLFMFISNSVLVYTFKYHTNSFLLFLSFFSGWAFSKVNLIRNFGVHKIGFFFSYNIFSNLIFGLFRQFLFYIVLKGMGFKFICVRNVSLLLKLGFSHRIFFKTPSELYIYFKHKQAISFTSRSFFFIKNLIFNLLNLKRISVYKKKGIFFKGALFSIKLTSKKLKF